MKAYHLLFAIALALAVISGLLRAQNDPPSWVVVFYIAASAAALTAEALRRRGKPNGE